MKNLKIVIIFNLCLLLEIQNYHQMTLINIITGAFLIVLGFLVKKFPDLIAGYNTMSAEQKEKVDIDGLSTMMRNSFIVIGILLAISDPVLSLIGLKQHATMALPLIILSGTFFILIRAQTFKGKFQNQGRKNTTRTVIISIVLVVIAFITFGFLYYGTRKPDFKIAKKQITISGLYGMTTQVESVEIIESLPQINMKTNGFNFGSVRKGNFYLKNIGQCKLFINSKNGPFIYVNTKNGTPIIINTESEKETEELSMRLAAELEK